MWNGSSCLGIGSGGTVFLDKVINLQATTETSYNS